MMSAENSEKTARGRPFEVGKSGNPGGRPKIPEDVKEAIRAACPKAVAVLVALLDDKKSLIRLEAAKIILERGYGKPEAMSKVELTGTNQPIIAFRWMTDENTPTTTV